jgi:folate-binding Fe-S cluster repair protein YgfZ
MLNYESVGGVNFKKGCYPGQEVVARSQFRGTLKRRAYLVHADAPLQAGQDVFEAADAEQPAGTVAEAAAAPGGGWDAIVSMQVAAAAGRLAAGSADGPALAVQPLPYGLLEDI